MSKAYLYLINIPIAFKLQDTAALNPDIFHKHRNVNIMIPERAIKIKPAYFVNIPKYSPAKGSDMQKFQ